MRIRMLKRQFPCILKMIGHRRKEGTKLAEQTDCKVVFIASSRVISFAEYANKSRMIGCSLRKSVCFCLNLQRVERFVCIDTHLMWQSSYWIAQTAVCQLTITATNLPILSGNSKLHRLPDSWFALNKFHSKECRQCPIAAESLVCTTCIHAYA